VTDFQVSVSWVMAKKITVITANESHVLERLSQFNNKLCIGLFSSYPIRKDMVVFYSTTLQKKKKVLAGGKIKMLC
jgi:hypothetical protein